MVAFIISANDALYRLNQLRAIPQEALFRRRAFRARARRPKPESCVSSGSSCSRFPTTCASTGTGRWSRSRRSRSCSVTPSPAIPRPKGTTWRTRRPSRRSSSPARAAAISPRIALVDKVQIEGEFTDPFYKIRRDKMLLIGADCSECGESCFCNLLGAKPWPEKGCDLAVSKIQGGYLVEALGERGEKLIRENKELFAEARDAQIKMRDETRAKVVKDLEGKNKAYPKADAGLAEAMREALERRDLGRYRGPLRRVRRLHEHMPDVLLLPPVRSEGGRLAFPENIRVGFLPGHRLRAHGGDAQSAAAPLRPGQAPALSQVRLSSLEPRGDLLHADAGAASIRARRASTCARIAEADQGKGRGARRKRRTE